MEPNATRYRLSWPAGETIAPGSRFLSRVFEDRLAVRHFVSEGFARDKDEAAHFRIEAIGANGSRIEGPVYAGLNQIEAWADGTAMPGTDVKSAWAQRRYQASVRRRSTRAIRLALIEAWKARALDREQVADILSTVDQAFERLGPASTRLPH